MANGLIVDSAQVFALQSLRFFGHEQHSCDRWYGRYTPEHLRLLHQLRLRDESDAVQP